MKLREIRKERGLSMIKLSELSGVDPRVSTMVKLADALKVTLDKICR